MAKRTRMYEPYGYREGEAYYSLRNAIDNEIGLNRRTDEQQDADIDALSGSVKDIQDTIGTITSGGTYETIDARITANKENIDKILDEAFFNVQYSDDAEALVFYNDEGEAVASVKMTDIIGSHLVKSAVYDKERKKIVITFDNDDVVEIDCADLLDIEEYADGLVVNDGVLSVKKDASSEKVIVDASGTEADVLSISMDGVKVANIQKAIDVEKDRAIEAENAEAAARRSYDEYLEGRINSEETSRISDVSRLDTKIDTEVSRLDARVDSEREDRQTQAARLDTSIANVSTNLTNETLARESADSEIRTMISNTKTELNASILEEKNRAVAAEEELSRRIDEGSSEHGDLVDRVVALENKVAVLEEFMQKVNDALHIDGQNIGIFVEGDWENLNELVSQLVNETFP